MIAHVINPGSSGVKLACATLEPSANPALPGQLRLQLTRAELPLHAPPTAGAVPALTQAIMALTADWPAPHAVVGRGGFIGRVPTGTYRVTEALAAYAVQGRAPRSPQPGRPAGAGAGAGARRARLYRGPAERR
ncbi:hypothetical protein [Deinococcus multiflagellatus]|uniref:Butyrate kinase n=1 Tax=Deinococcus multiflagellatus TaxID=1656887 RepID=A0ABW1ZHV7_9DEIO